MIEQPTLNRIGLVGLRTLSRSEVLYCKTSKQLGKPAVKNMLSNLHQVEGADGAATI